MDNNYYIYVYLDPRKKGVFIYGEYEFGYEPFYIGKGKEERLNKLFGRNEYFKNKVSKIKESGLEPLVIKLKGNLTEDDSFLLEIELIDIIGRKDLESGPLINFTDGGEGVSGRVVSEGEREKSRKDFSKIQKEFENRKYKLLIKENEYKNNHQKLNYICPNGHKGSVTWNSFQREMSECLKCSYEKRSRKQRMNFSKIVKEFERRGYNLLTEENEYKNAFTKLKYICPEGHKNSINWSDFKREINCPDCYNELRSRKQRMNFSEIIKEFERRGYNLLTEENEYKNSKQQLKYLCKRGHKHCICWNNLQQGHSCPKCNKENREKNKIKITQYETDNMFMENM